MKLLYFTHCLIKYHSNHWKNNMVKQWNERTNLEESSVPSLSVPFFGVLKCLWNEAMLLTMSGLLDDVSQSDVVQKRYGRRFGGNCSSP